MNTYVNDNNKDRLVLVSGASRGIGKAIAKSLLHEGYSVHLCARSNESLVKVAEELSVLGFVTYSSFDLYDKNQISEFINSWKKDLYGIVNNAGICKTEKLLDNSDVWNEVINTNLNGMYWLTKGLAPYLVDNGRIVNISSQLGKEGRAGYGAYCASKFGIIGLTKCWAKELGNRGITVNAVCPGWVSTEMSTNDMIRLAREAGVEKEEYYRRICEPLELKRFTTPEEVANLVAFLISNNASGITGRAMLLNTIWNQE